MKNKLKIFQAAFLCAISIICVSCPAFANDLSASVTPATAPYPTGDNGAIDLHVNGGYAPFTFSWTGPYGFTATTEDVEDVFPGNYHVVVTDALCGVAELDVIVCVGSITINDLEVDVLPCPGKHLGEIMIEEWPSGGQKPYTYEWSNGTTGFLVENLTAGTYCVTVTDALGCTASDCIVVENDPNCKDCEKVTVYDMTVVQPPCPGAANGAISVTADQGNNPIVAYTWSTGQTTTNNSISGLTAGGYCVTLTDNVGCTGTSCMNLKDTGPGTLGFTNVQIQAATGPWASDGSISLQMFNGIEPYTFSWLGPNGFTAETLNISNLEPGNYCLTVNDGSGCRETKKCFEVPVLCPSPLLTGVLDYNYIDCYGGTGKFTALTSMLGAEPYTFNWSNGETSATIENIPAGKYCVTVTDAQGCSDEDCFDMTEPQAIKTGFASLINAGCDGQSGSITLAVLGGTPSYTYLWNDGSTQKDRTNLAEGEYCVTVTDSKGCTDEACFTIKKEDGSIQIQEISVQNATSCKEDCTGAIDIEPYGAGPFTYSWEGPNGFTASSQDVSSLCVGDYSVTVSMEGCTGVKKFGICCCESVDDVPGGQPAGSCYDDGKLVFPLTISGHIRGVKAINDGAINVTVSEGTGEYSFSWTGSNGFTANTEDISGLVPGIYCLTVQDGCNVLTRCFDVVDCNTVGLAVNGTVTHTCPGVNAGAISISISGGSEPFQIAWGIGGNAQALNFLGQGTYCVTVTDNTECTASNCFTIDDINNFTSAPSSFPCGNNILCNGFQVAFDPVELSWGYTNPFDCTAYEGPCPVTGQVEDVINVDYVSLEINEADCTIVGQCPNGDSQVAVFGQSFTAAAVGSPCSGCIVCFTQEGCLFDIDGVPSFFSTQEILQSPPDEGPASSNSQCESGCARQFSCSPEVTFSLCVEAFECDGGLTGEVPSKSFVFDSTEDLTISEAFWMHAEYLQSGTKLMLPEGMNPSMKYSEYWQHLSAYKAKNGNLPLGSYTSYSKDELDCGRFCEAMSGAKIFRQEGNKNTVHINAQPNPFDNSIEVIMTATMRTDVLVEMVNVLGVKILTKSQLLEKGENRMPLEFEKQLPAGLYFLTVKDKDGNVIKTLSMTK